MVSERGKAVNWKNPKADRAISKNKYVPKLGTGSSGFPFKKHTIGTREQAITVGMAVFKKTKGSLLSLRMEYRKKVAIDSEKQMIESKIPKKS